MIIKIKKSYLDKYKNGFPLLINEYLDYKYKTEDEGKIVELLDYNKNFIASAYIGKQNKGLGWVFSNERKTTIDAYFITDKIKISKNLRKSYFSNEETNAFRLFNGYGDGIGGLTIDYFDGFLLLNWYNKGIFRFHELIIDCLISELNPKGIYQKIRFKDTELKSLPSLVYGEEVAENFYIKENNLKYSINFNDGDMVGVFLDQREVRKLLITKFSNKKKILNTFSYTGAFSVAALGGNALQTTSVDLAKRSFEKTMNNFKLNNFKTENQKIVVEDVFNYFKYAIRKQMSFDIIILDPPSFAKSKKRTFSVLKNYTELIEETAPLVARNGYIIASVNNSQLFLNSFKKMIYHGFDKTGRKFQIEKVFRLPDDFRVADNYKEENYLKVLLIKVD